MIKYHSQYFEDERQALLASVPGNLGYTPVAFHAIGDDIQLDNAVWRFYWRAPEIFKQALKMALQADEQFDRLGYVTRVEMLLGQAAFNYNDYFTLPTTELQKAIQTLTAEPVLLEAVAADLVLPFGLRDLRHVVHLTKWTFANHTIYHLVAGLPALEAKVDAFRNAGVYQNEAKFILNTTELDSAALLTFAQDLIRDHFGVETDRLQNVRAAFGTVSATATKPGDRILIADFEN